MNFNPQIQNPNPSPSQLVKHHTHWILVAAVIVLVSTFFILRWYVDEMDFKIGSQSQFQAPLSTEQQLGSEAESVNLGDIDSEFQSIDTDLNSL